MDFFLAVPVATGTSQAWGSNLSHTNDNSISLTARPPGNAYYYKVRVHGFRVPRASPNLNT